MKQLSDAARQLWGMAQVAKDTGERAPTKSAMLAAAQKRVTDQHEIIMALRDENRELREQIAQLKEENEKLRISIKAAIEVGFEGEVNEIERMVKKWSLGSAKVT